MTTLCINPYNELDEKYAQDDDGRIVLKELYSYTEEDGWQLGTT